VLDRLFSFHPKQTLKISVLQGSAWHRWAGSFSQGGITSEYKPISPEAPAVPGSVPIISFDDEDEE
jgi:hypothetical protein